MSYQVWVRMGGQWLPASRPFEKENEAQDWALDLDTRWAREVRKVEW